MLFTAYVFCSLRLFKLKPEWHTIIKKGDLSEKLQTWNHILTNLGYASRGLKKHGPSVYIRELKSFPWIYIKCLSLNSLKKSYHDYKYVF